MLAGLERGSAAATPQPEEGVTYAARLTREDGLLDWSARSAEEVDRMVRALNPWPGVTADLARGWSASWPEGRSPGDETATAGTVIRTEGESAVVATAAGVYRVDIVQPSGRRPMSAAAFLRGGGERAPARPGSKPDCAAVWEKWAAAGDATSGAPRAGDGLTRSSRAAPPLSRPPAVRAEAGTPAATRG